jgi:hypothetical protein
VNLLRRLFGGLLRDAATALNAPNGQPLAAYWQAQDKDMTVRPAGGGSDHEPFVYHENIPAAGAGYGGPFGTYHSAYDDPASLRVLDPGMHEAAAAARYTSIVVLRLADATYPDLRSRADAAIAQGNADAADAAYVQLRASEDAFFQSDSSQWSRTLLYSVSGYEGTILPSLDDTLGPNGSTDDVAKCIQGGYRRSAAVRDVAAAAISSFVPLVNPRRKP